MENFDLKEELQECRKYAANGYKIASSQSKSLNKTLSNAKSKIQDTINEFNNSACYISSATEALQSQLTEIQGSFDELSKSLERDLKVLKENSSKFSITLFGRTMAGKSTLMEILTEGNGESIGKGAQRTTRDVRKYEWNNLQITDVPGIGAFEGQEDEEIAFEAAKKADLILFLITDDGPQAKEAECFGRIVNLGKPVICIMNVKAAISEDKSVKSITKNINKKFDKEKLESIRNQFLAYSKELGQDWGYLPFIYVHLRSAFLSQQIEDREKAQVLYELSRVNYLKKRIIQEVRFSGKFYRVKNFVDIISKPILDSMDSLLYQSQINSTQGRVIVSKKRALEQWNKTFYDRGKSQINSFITKAKSELNSEVASFAEDHFDDENADEAWKKVIKERDIESKCEDLMKGLEEQCNDKIKEISREILNELKYSSHIVKDKSLKMGKIIDSKRIWNWSSIVIGGGLGIGAIIASFAGAAISGPLGWIAVGIGVLGYIGSLFFSSREEKENEARMKLEKALRKNVTKICDSLEKQLNKNLDVLVKRRMSSLIKELDRINAVIFKLADTQKELAWNLNKQLRVLNTEILTEAIKLIGAEGLQYHVESVARIPGNSVVMMLGHGTVFPQEYKKKLSSLMSEKIAFVHNTDNKKVLISRILGKAVDVRSISIEEKIGVAHILVENLTPSLKNRVKIAQQFSEIMITK